MPRRSAPVFASSTIFIARVVLRQEGEHLVARLPKSANKILNRGQQAILVIMPYEEIHDDVSIPSR